MNAIFRQSSPGRAEGAAGLLCGHHYRLSRAALSAAHASVHELAGNLADPSAWFHDDRRQRAQAPVAAG